VAPTVVAVGAVDSVTPWVPGLPIGWAENDILLIVGENIGGEAQMAATGYAHAATDGSPVSPVVQGVNTQLNVLWKRATASESAPTVTGPSNHAVTRMIAIRGCPLTGNPWNIVSVASSAVSDVNAAWPGVTTTLADCLILEIIATGTDVASTAQLGALTNGTYTSITEQMDNWAATGTGGGIALVSGVKAIAGATGSSTATLVTAATKAYMTLAMAPAPAGTAVPTLVMAPM